MADVTLVLKADNTQYVKSVNEAQKATQKLNDTAEQGAKKRLGLIEATEKRIQNLTRLQKQATTEELIAQKGQMLAAANKDLEKYNRIAKEAQGQTESLTHSIGKWAMGIAGVSVIVGALKEALMKLTVVINAVNVAGAAYTQVLYNITTGQASWLNGVVQAIKIQQQFNNLRMEGYKEAFLAQEKETKFQKAWYEALNNELSLKDRIRKADEALAAKEEEVAIKREHAQKVLQANLGKILLQQGSEENVKAFWAAMTELKALDAEYEQSTKRLYRMTQGLKKQDHEESIKKWMDEIDQMNEINEKRLQQEEAYQKKAKQLIERYEQSNIESLTGAKKLKAQEVFALKQLDEFRKEMTALGTLTPEQESMFIILGQNIHKATLEGLAKEGIQTAETKNIFSDFLDKLLTPDVLKKPKPVVKDEEFSIWKLMGIDPDSDEGKKQQEALMKAKDTIISVIDEIQQKRVDDATRRRELLDTQIDETQQELETEMRLYEDGYASNVAAKKKELAELKKQRALALKQEEDAIKRQRQMDTITQVSALITASAQTFKAFPGPLLPVAIAVIATMFAAFAATKVRANQATKLAEGGSGTDTGIITGRSHRQGGEKFLSQVEVERGESWGVLSIPATQKFGKVFHHMVSSFNKGQIPVLPASKILNSVSVENSGPNSRLDQVITEQRRLNAKLSGDSIQEFGNMRVVRKGHTVRIISR